ncbi:hypothetical protein [Pedobacter sp. SL55]|uniref:hypothetical protein n=1 Tax=Pedobacter sp. SL55 TaxID=2995161 RepID=UPI00226D96A0|nr:hypothetical protein [Pedobacter sp. SL55]WAC40630.1 hypothetical protein OVA16_19000 [Pedobacter sp. SL55]
MYDVTNKFENEFVRKMYQNFNSMENYKDKKEKETKVDLIDIDDTKPARSEENIEKAPTSAVETKFNKNHTRRHEPMGGSHEPGTTPGTGF